jgi:2,3-bisphosphoglycerate-dependent phosphoglycerate mutase
MARVFLVRHGEPSESVGLDPDLTPLGVEQAARLVDVLEPCALLTSPLQRARSTAQALADRWGVDAIVDETFRELPSPTTSVQERRAWLGMAMRSNFADLGPGVAEWHAGILRRVREMREDTVVVTHALVINAVVGACVGDERVLHVRPGHASVTTVEVGADGALALVEQGPDVESLIG